MYCAYNALFSDADSAPQAFKAVSKALKPGGRFLLDTTNRERLAQADNPARVWRGGGELPWLLEETRFDLLTGAQRIVQRRISRDGHVEERPDALSLHARRTQPTSGRYRTRPERRLWWLAARPLYGSKPTNDTDRKKGSLIWNSPNSTTR